MAKSGEFYTFDEVVRQLSIDENKLKRLVSEGEISAFREGDVMKFKKSEIDKLSTKGMGSETSETVLSEITLEDEAPAFEESGETLTDDLVFEGAGTSDEVDLGTVEGAPGEEISSQDTFIEEKPADADVGMTTEPIDLSADLTQEVEEEEIEEMEEPSRRAVPRTMVRRAEPAAPAVSPFITFCLVLTTILGFLAVYVGWNASNNELGSKAPGNIATKMTGWFYDGMGGKETVTNHIEEETSGLDRVSTSGAEGEGD